MATVLLTQVIPDVEDVGIILPIGGGLGLLNGALTYDGLPITFGGTPITYQG